MSSFNKVILMGRLTRDPELRHTQGGTAVCKVGLAVNHRFKDKQSGEWREDVTFIDITIFGKRAEAFEKYHRKGAEAFFEGRLAFDTWDDKNSGAKRSKLYVIADSWEFVGGKSEQKQGQGWQPSDGEARPAESQQAYATTGADEQAFIEADDTPF